MQYAEIIRDIINHLECTPDMLVRVPCVYCGCGKTLILDPQNGSYECQACGKHGRLQDLVTLCQDRFERRHRETMQLMAERAAVERIVGRR